MMLDRLSKTPSLHDENYQCKSVSPEITKGPIARPTLNKTTTASIMSLTRENDDQDMLPFEFVLKQ